ncbi:MAG TPA: permease-like cell division protein FtsX [Candidatus Paceibacterota bacterium]|nr:permease-like cell division protein FtsX [Candidatus Paceibacterota bacterium]HRZ29651.1 permease-like cell division protein FtsX [Candidatus Paceibacterota bacterium]
MSTPISTNLKRIFQKGKSIFKRNGWLTIATIVTMFLSILVFTGVLIMNYASNRFISSLKDKIDISIYFKPSIEESEILLVQEQLGKVSGVVKTEYVSRDKALEFFKERYGHNDTVIKALEEIGENPLSASVNIKIKDAKDYESVLAYIETAVFKDKLVNINFTENRDLLNKTTSLINSLRIGSMVITIVLTAVAVIVAFNTIRIAIYSMREEVNIMKLVGATN